MNAIHQKHCCFFFVGFQSFFGRCPCDVWLELFCFSLTHTTYKYDWDTGINKITNFVLSETNNTFYYTTCVKITIIKASFVLSFLYNVIGMYFALTGQLTPVVAAILMPLSSISIVVFVTILTNWVSKRV